MDRQASAALDRYLTRGPYDYDEPQQPRCEECSGFLKLTPDRSEEWENRDECDGKLKSFESQYDATTMAILGSDAERTYRVHYFDCGHHDSNSYDVSADTPAHEPHSVVVAAGFKHYRKCSRCGHENVEIDG